MKSKINKAYKKAFGLTEYTFFVGDVPGELKKVRGLFQRAIRDRSPKLLVDHTTVRKICTSPPTNQTMLVAKARGEQYDRFMFNPILTIRII